MKKLNIESFDSPEEKNENKEQEINIDEVISSYEEKLNQQKLYFEQKLKEETKKAYEEGYKKAKEELQNEIKQQIYDKENQLKQLFENQKIQITNEYEQKFQQSINNIKSQVEQFLSKLEEDYQIYKENIQNTIFEVLEEILTYLFIDPKNTETIKQNIKNILDQFDGENPVKIVINKDFAKYIQDINTKIKTEKIDFGDFIIDFGKFQIESNFKEKLEKVKNELKAEIEKSSKIQNNR